MLDEKLYCSFCGRSADKVERLISGPDGVAICNDCIETCNDILRSYFKETPDGLSSEVNLLTPEELKGKLDEYIIGQDEAKKVLSTITINASGKRPTPTTRWFSTKATCWCWGLRAAAKPFLQKPWPEF